MLTEKQLQQVLETGSLTDDAIPGVTVRRAIRTMNTGEAQQQDNTPSSTGSNRGLPSSDRELPSDARPRRLTEADLPSNNTSIRLPSDGGPTIHNRRK